MMTEIPNKPILETPPQEIPSEQIFEGRKEVLINHEGVIYRLRITNRGKLLLQK